VPADNKSNTLYVCSDDFSAAGIEVPGSAATPLKLFDLKTGEPKGSSTLGQATLCNDIAVAKDGTTYVTDSFASHILRLKPGAKEFKVWAHDARWNVPGKPELSDIAILSDGAIYANIFDGGGCTAFRSTANARGDDHQAANVRPLHHSDGLKAFGPNKLIQVEGETKGNLDLITIDGDNAKVETIKEGFDGPVSLAQVATRSTSKTCRAVSPGSVGKGEEDSPAVQGVSGQSAPAVALGFNPCGPASPAASLGSGLEIAPGPQPGDRDRRRLSRLNVGPQVVDVRQAIAAGNPS
jgi:hypothetical protein